MGGEDEGVQRKTLAKARRSFLFSFSMKGLFLCGSSFFSSLSLCSAVLWL